MMLHRHFESEKSENVTKLSDLGGKKESEVSNIFPPDEEKAKRTRKRKSVE